MLPAQKPLCIPKSSPTHHHALQSNGHVEVQHILHLQHHDLPSELNIFIFVSSLKTMCFQSSMVKFSYLYANLTCARTCLRLRNGFLCCTCAPNPTSLKARLIMTSDNNLHVSDRSCFVVANAVPSRP